MESHVPTGWEQLLSLQGERGAGDFESALASDLWALESSDPEERSALETSLLRASELVARDVLWLQVEGKFGALEELRLMLLDLLQRFPRLMRLRDLSPADNAGCRLDAIAQDLVALSNLPSDRRSRALFDEASRGGSTRRAVMDCLASTRDWVHTTTLRGMLQRKHEELALSRQGLHAVLGKLREHGLVLRDPQGRGHSFRLSLTGQRLWREIEQEAETKASTEDGRSNPLIEGPFMLEESRAA